MSTKSGSSIETQNDLKDGYVDLYKNSHVDTGTDYLIVNSEYLIINPLLAAGSSVLILGCGTAGSAFQLLSKARHIVGVDLSKKMLSAADELSKKSEVEFISVCDSIESYRPSATKTFDFIDVGLLGAYIPIDHQIPLRYLEFLKPGGFLLVRTLVIRPWYAAPSMFQAAKSIVKAMLVNILYKLLPKVRFSVAGTVFLAESEVRHLVRLGHAKHLMSFSRNVHSEEISNYYSIIQKPY
jgi:SAM-dependent methyltransferase